MSRRDDIMGLGPFVKGLEERLARLPKDDISRILVQHGKTLTSSARRGFLELFEHAPAPASPRPSPGQGSALIDAVRAFVKDLENGKYYEGTAFDQETGDYRSYGDESWVEVMDDLFGSANDAFLHGDRAIAAEAYGLLLGSFSLEDGGGHFCGATYATEMVATDLPEAKSRYLRALYDITPARDRPKRMLEQMYVLRHRGRTDTGIKAVLEADAAPPSRWTAFLTAWIRLLRDQDPDSNLTLLNLAGWLLREAVMMKDGLAGLEKLADERGADDPEVFREWMDELLRLGRSDEARDVARRASEQIQNHVSRAHFADRWAAAATTAAEILEARRSAWRIEPTLERLVSLYASGMPSDKEAKSRMLKEREHCRSARIRLDARVEAVLLLLSGAPNEAAALLPKSDPLSWDRADPGPVLYPFLLLAVAGKSPLTRGSVLSLWRHELEATAAADAQGMYAETGNEAKGVTGLWNVLCASLRDTPPTDTERNTYLDITKTTMTKRVATVLNAQDRGSYDRAARMLVGWVEAARNAGHNDEASALLNKVTKDYSRRPSFRKAIAALTGPSIGDRNDAQEER